MHIVDVVLLIIGIVWMIISIKIWFKIIKKKNKDELGTIHDLVDPGDEFNVFYSHEIEEKE